MYLVEGIGRWAGWLFATQKLAEIDQADWIEVDRCLKNDSVGSCVTYYNGIESV